MLSTSGTQTDSALVYDSDGSTEVHHSKNCYDNDIFNMFIQEEQYTELLEPILEPRQLQQNDSNFISEVFSVEQGGKTVEQHPATVEETRAYFESLYNNLPIEVEKVNTANRKLRETNADLTIELARYKNQEKCFEISQEKYDKLESVKLLCMRTRNSYYPNNSPVTIPRRQNRRRAPNIVEPELRTIVEVAPMAENRTMEELLQAPTEGYGEAIVIPEINADHFEIKTNLLQLVQANPFRGFERENPHTHINNFKRITSTLKFRDVPNDVIKLMMFSYSLEGAARVWYDKEPPNSILTWDDLLTQIDTFYNGLNKNDQESLNAVSGGNLLSKTTREALNIIANKSKVCYSRNKPNVSRVNTTSRESSSRTDDRIDKLADQISTLVEIVNKKVVTPAMAKAVEELCVICGGAHAYYDCIATDSNQSSVCAATGTYNQVAPPNRASNHMAPPGFASIQNSQNRYNQNQGQGNNFNRGNNFHGNQGFQVPNNHAPNFQNQGFQNQPFNQVQQGIPNEFSSYMKSNESMMRNMQSQINELRGNFNKQEESLRRNLNNDMRSILGGFFQNQASTSGTLLSNTIPNPKGEIKAITTRSGVAYEGPSIPTNPSPKKVLKQETEETTDKEQTNLQRSTAHIQPSIIPIPIPKPDVPKTLPKPNIPYLSQLNQEKLHEKSNAQIMKFLEIFQKLHFDISFADALLYMPKFAFMFKSLISNKEKLFELLSTPLNENSSARLSLPELTTTRMTLELADRSITRPKGVVEDVFVKVGKFHFSADFVVVDFYADLRVPLILGRPFLRTSHALIDVYGEEITLRFNDEAITFNLGHTSRYSSDYYAESVNQIDIIDVAYDEYSQEVLGFLDCFKSGNPTSTDPIIATSFPSLTPYEGGDFILEEIENCISNGSIPPGINDEDFDPGGDICLIEKLLNDDPFQLHPMDLKQVEVTKAKSTIEEPPELELKHLPSHLEYAYLEGNDKLPVIITKGLKNDEKSPLKGA
ncbi:reverse transcriptase domain-containing protein [Tanacetum coccineum]